MAAITRHRYAAVARGAWDAQIPPVLSPSLGCTTALPSAGLNFSIIARAASRIKSQVTLHNSPMMTF